LKPGTTSCCAGFQNPAARIRPRAASSPVAASTGTLARVESRELLDALVGLAEEAGIAVRVSGRGEGELPPRSGLCRVRGNLLLVLSAAEPLEARIEAAAAALGAHGAALLEGRFLPPAVRERLERAAQPPGRSR